MWYTVCWLREQIPNVWNDRFFRPRFCTVRVYTRPGTTWAYEINFVVNHALRCRIDRSTWSTVVQRATTELRSAVSLNPPYILCPAHQQGRHISAEGSFWPNTNYGEKKAATSICAFHSTNNGDTWGHEICEEIIFLWVRSIFTDSKRLHGLLGMND